MIEQIFNIGDEVETNEIYQYEIEKLNKIFDRRSPTHFKGKITRFQLVTGIAAGDRPWIHVTLDNDVNKQVNQTYLRRITKQDS